MLVVHLCGPIRLALGANHDGGTFLVSFSWLFRSVFGDTVSSSCSIRGLISKHTWFHLENRNSAMHLIRLRRRLTWMPINPFSSAPPGSKYMPNNPLISVDSTKNRFAGFLPLGLFFAVAPKRLALSTGGAIKPANMTLDGDYCPGKCESNLLALSASILDQPCAPRCLKLRISGNTQAVGNSEHAPSLFLRAFCVSGQSFPLLLTIFKA